MLKFVFASCLAAGLTLSHGANLGETTLDNGGYLSRQESSEFEQIKAAIKKGIDEKMSCVLARSDFVDLKALASAIDPITTLEKLLDSLSRQRHLNALAKPMGPTRASIASKLVESQGHRSNEAWQKLVTVLRKVLEARKMEDDEIKGKEEVAAYLEKQLNEFAETLMTSKRTKPIPIMNEAKELIKTSIKAERSLHSSNASRDVNDATISKDIKDLKAAKEALKTHFASGKYARTENMETVKKINEKYFADGYLECVEALETVAAQLTQMLQYQITFKAQAILDFGANLRVALLNKITQAKADVERIKELEGGGPDVTKINEFGHGQSE